MGLDPGFRTGVKVAVVDATGKLLDTATIYPHEPRNDWQGSLATLAALCMKHKVELVASATARPAARPTSSSAELIAKMPNLKLTKVMVSEAGASVYSASELAAEGVPGPRRVSLRGAVSIARRLQDPLAELVKIEPKAIGVGQYQHDVDQARPGALARRGGRGLRELGRRRRQHGVGAAAGARVGPEPDARRQHRRLSATRTAPSSRAAALKKVPRLGPKTFEQAAGFLRIMDGKNPLDGSAVHPEAYPVVEQISEATGRPAQGHHRRPGVPEVAQAARRSPTRQFGMPTVDGHPRRAGEARPRPAPRVQDGDLPGGRREDLDDLKPGMQLEGVVTNVTAFGAFVDVGVHQDGLVHISELSDRFVKDPREVVKAGDVVKVRVKEVDVARKRIALTMKSGAIDRSAGPRPSAPPSGPRSASAPRHARPRAPGRERPGRRPPPRAGAQMSEQLSLPQGFALLS